MFQYFFTDYQRRVPRHADFVIPKIEIHRNVSFDLTFFKSGKKLVRSQSVLFEFIRIDEDDDSSLNDTPLSTMDPLADADSNEGDQPSQLKIVKNVSFGAKGRKRRHSVYPRIDVMPVHATPEPIQTSPPKSMIPSTSGVSPSPLLPKGYVANMVLIAANRKIPKIDLDVDEKEANVNIEMNPDVFDGDFGHFQFSDSD